MVQCGPSLLLGSFSSCKVLSPRPIPSLAFQRSQAVIDEKNRQIKSLQRQMERDSSQARLDELRLESAARR